MKKCKKRNYIVYKVTNKINDKIYIGSHVTENINDNYMGSGTNIRKAIDEFGKENFDKIILYNFDNKEDMIEKEMQLVNKEFIKREDTYNIIIGGGFNTLDTFPAKDVDGNIFQIHKEDPRYLSGEIVYYSKGYVTAKDKNDNTFRVHKEDPRYLSGELVHMSKNKILVRDENFNYKMVDYDDDKIKSGEFISATKGMVIVKDSDENYLLVHKEDPRYLSGELKHIWYGRKHTDKTKRKIGEKNSIYQKGKGNSQYGTCWIYNEKLKENKKIKKEELEKYIKSGWIKGRKIKIK